MISVFIKLKRDCREIYLDQTEKIISVLSKNIEVGLNEKVKAAIQLANYQKTLYEDYKDSERVLLNTTKYKEEDKAKYLLSIVKITEEENDSEEVPEEVDKGRYTIRNPSETKRFFNRFQELQGVGSEVLSGSRSEFMNEFGEFDKKKGGKPIACVQKSATEFNLRSSHTRAKTTCLSKFK